ncbi:MAG TPA: hypothetical protein VKA58_13590 [Propionibacteriaceae bacterium]|jgi:hypothetical protein|nr:hypothetical protein [Propionibacteriaceae bacterium]
MSSRPSDYARRLGQIAGKAGPEADAGQQPPGDEHQEPQPMPTVTDRPPPTRPARRRSQRVRITVDLDRDKHRGLRLFAVEADTDASEVVRLLIDRLLRDPGFAERVRAELEQD